MNFLSASIGKDEENYLLSKKDLQRSLIDFVEDNSNFNDFKKKIYDQCQKILDSYQELKSLLYLFANVMNNHYRLPGFFEKFEALLLFLGSKSLLKKFSNKELFNIFKSNKRILLFLFKNNIITLTKEIANSMLKLKYYNAKYPHYFLPEIDDYIDSKFSENIKKESQILLMNDSRNRNTIEYFEEKRNCGKNDQYLSELIQNDLIEEFVIYTSRLNLSLKTEKIRPSIFETNSFLIERTPSLIEYSAFYGSIQILRYLFLNKVELTPSIWIYAIHSNNPEIIHFVEENLKISDPFYYRYCLCESIKCHHLEISCYIIDNLIQEQADETMSYFDYNEFDWDPSLTSIKYYNYINFPDDLNDQVIIHYLCLFDYSSIIKKGFQTKTIILDSTKQKKLETLKKSAKRGNVKIVEYLLREGAEEKIESNLFKNCVVLKKFNIPFNIKTIEEYAFSGCLSLEKVTFDEHSQLETIGNYAFSNCSELKTFSMPPTVRSIGFHSFDRCESITEMVLPPSLKRIEEATFIECKSLTKIDLPSSLLFIGKYAFFNCSKLEIINIPFSLEFIDDYVFYGCLSLTKIFLDSEHIWSLNRFTFCCCSKLNEIKLPPKLIYIRDNAFCGCSEIERIHIPPSVNSIGIFAFFGCSKLKEINVPSGVTALPTYVFYNCVSLEEIAIPASVEIIDDNCFENCSSLKKILFSDNSNLKIIGKECFKGCSSIEQIKIPSSVVEIKKFAFEECSSLIEISIPYSVKFIDMIGINNEVKIRRVYYFFIIFCF